MRCVGRAGRVARPVTGACGCGCQRGGGRSCEAPHCGAGGAKGAGAAAGEQADRRGAVLGAGASGRSFCSGVAQQAGAACVGRQARRARFLLGAPREVACVRTNACAAWRALGSWRLWVQAVKLLHACIFACVAWFHFFSMRAASGSGCVGAAWCPGSCASGDVDSQCRCTAPAVAHGPTSATEGGPPAESRGGHATTVGAAAVHPAATSSRRRIDAARPAAFARPACG